MELYKKYLEHGIGRGSAHGFCKKNFLVPKFFIITSTLISTFAYDQLHYRKISLLIRVFHLMFHLNVNQFLPKM